jgi:ABC-type branched-subunit amino acid transport system permease subunit
MKRVKHWQDAVNAILGLWLIASPWALGFAADRPVFNNAVIVGIALLAFAVASMFAPQAWEEWIAGALGLWLIASPWILGFSAMHAVMLAMVATGVVVLALSAWTVAIDKGYQIGWPHTPAH